MQDYKPFIYSTIILNFIIVVGVGHGVGCIGLVEIISFPYVNRDGFSLNLSTFYDGSVLSAAPFFAIGEVLLYITLWIHNRKRKLLTRLIAIILLWAGFFYLTQRYFSDGAAKVSFWTGTPFLLVSLGLFISTILSYKNIRNIKMEKETGTSGVKR